jgi:hypothetical protein
MRVAGTAARIEAIYALHTISFLAPFQGASLLNAKPRVKTLG